jgi:chromosome segregation ATPase
VIYYITGDRDHLKEECASLHVEIGALTVNFTKEMEVLAAEVRKLKEIIKDKESECDSIARTLKKEKEIYEQENERMNYQLKSMIEKKTDEIYAISRQKEMENQQTKRNLESIIEELKIAHQKEISGIGEVIPNLKAEISEWQARHEALERELEDGNERHEADKLKASEEH